MSDPNPDDFANEEEEGTEADARKKRVTIDIPDDAPTATTAATAEGDDHHHRPSIQDGCVRDEGKPSKSVAAFLENQHQDEGGKINMLSANRVDPDADMLNRALADAGRWAFGIMMAEVWIYPQNESGASARTLRIRLERPPGGLWIDPVYLLSDSSGALERLIDPTRDNYVPPAPLIPGEGLAGILWTETDHTGVFGDFDKDSASRGGKVAWRDVRSLANDPDRPPNKRVKIFADAGFGWAAGVPFNVRKHMGIVVFLGRKAADPEKLRSELNEDYLRASADLIGAVYALREPRRACIEQRRQDAHEALRRARAKVFAMIRSRSWVKGTGSFVMPEMPEDKTGKEENFEQNLVEGQVPVESEGRFGRWTRSVHQKLQIWLIKVRGGGAAYERPKPPAFIFFSFVSAFVTMLALTQMHLWIREESDFSYKFILGALGALQTVVYDLPAAPASQPRNMILGQLLSIFIAIIFRYATDFDWEYRMPFAVALAAAAMPMLGVTHPPGSSLTVIFCDPVVVPEDEMWELLGFVIVADAVLVAIATTINNFNDKRQYPIYWGPTFDFIASKTINKPEPPKDVMEDVAVGSKID